jgi:hypothetical protein
VGDEWFEFEQAKHHRWRLDRPQIEQYALDLAHDCMYWEDIAVEPRRVQFTTANGRLTLCHLICEDLARIEPVSELIRAVGPNLIIALLLDGPQLAARWPGRYAGVFCDDPGSSVLTLTSLGMVELSRPPPGVPVSRSIALWRDAESGFRELQLAGDERAILLELELVGREEFTADGRSDGGAAGVVRYKQHRAL